jgi:Chlamydia-phage Chp2 scaffold (Chlamy_scaf)
VPGAEPVYLDVSDVPDLMGAHALIAAAESAFMTLPASVRREFDNDPIRFVEYAQDPANLDQMRAWKLAPPAPVAAPQGAASPGGAAPSPAAPPSPAPAAGGPGPSHT